MFFSLLDIIILLYFIVHMTIYKIKQPIALLVALLPLVIRLMGIIAYIIIISRRVFSEQLIKFRLLCDDLTFVFLLFAMLFVKINIIYKNKSKQQ